MLAELAFFATVAAYAAASGLFFTYLARPDGSPRAAKAAPRVLAYATILHAGYVYLASILANVCPVKSIHFVASIAALLASALYLVLRRRFSIDAVGAFVAPVALTFVLGARFVGRPDQPVGGGFLALHVTVNVLGDALFLLASGAAVLYLVEERRLKQKRAASVFGRLPPLDALDRVEHRLLLMGFPLLTLGIVTGAAWAHRIENGSAAEGARALFAFGTWIVFASVLVMRAALGWRGRRAAYGTIAGFIFAVAVLVVYLVRGASGGST
ncbi:MAG TPA: cytochrome c biogenesis protein CcsA [Polyangiaceae bacterium]|nr:cytochrome c biogenesis protein CcsA [Polyangiaceae bacterium]